MSIVVVGIDISKKKFDVAFTINQKWQHETFENTLDGFQIFLNFLKDRNIENCHGVMEATGRYGEDLANLLYISGLRNDIEYLKEKINFFETQLVQSQKEKEILLAVTQEQTKQLLGTRQVQKTSSWRHLFSKGMS